MLFTCQSIVKVQKHVHIHIQQSTHKKSLKTKYQAAIRASCSAFLCPSYSLVSFSSLFFSFTVQTQPSMLKFLLFGQVRVSMLLFIQKFSFYKRKNERKKTLSACNVMKVLNSMHNLSTTASLVVVVVHTRKRFCNEICKFLLRNCQKHVISNYIIHFCLLLLHATGVSTSQISMFITAR